jgi:hypothetical protein
LIAQYAVLCYGLMMDAEPVLTHAGLDKEPGAERPKSRTGRSKAVDPNAATGPKSLIVQPLPRWVGKSSGDPKASGHAVAQGQAGLVADVSFAAGAALFALDEIMRAGPPWLGAWQMRLTLKAAISAARLLRLGSDAESLRDALHLTRPGDDPGPAGRLHRVLRQWAARPLRKAAETEELVALEAGQGAGADELAALLAADRGLAEKLGWAKPLPLHLVAIHHPDLKQAADSMRLRACGPDWDQVRHAVLLQAATSAHTEAVLLARKAQALTRAAATLRTRDDGKGVALILCDDSVAPWRMVGATRSGEKGMNSDRAARRLCESLHAKGVLRLITDRPTFRLYGL